MLFSRRRQWHPTPVLLPGKSHGRRSLVGCSPRGREESDTNERLHFHFSLSCIGEGNDKPSHSSVLAWRIPGTGEPGGLPSTHRVGHDWSDLVAAACFSLVEATGGRLSTVGMDSRGHLRWAGIKPVSLHWQADSVPLNHSASLFYYLNITQNSIFVNQWMDPWLPSHPIILCFLNVYLIHSVNLEKNEDPIRINPTSSLIRCPFLTGLVVGQKDDGNRKAYSSLEHWRRDAGSSCSGDTSWVLHSVWGLSTPPDT